MGQLPGEILKGGISQRNRRQPKPTGSSDWRAGQSHSRHLGAVGDPSHRFSPEFECPTGWADACSAKASHGVGSERLFRNRLLVVQLIEQRPGLLQVERVEAFGQPAVDRREKIAGLAHSGRKTIATALFRRGRLSWACCRQQGPPASIIRREAPTSCR
jgi:hypothetical protein